MSRVDPATLHALRDENYRLTVRNTAYALLAAGDYRTVIELHGALLDQASGHFERIHTAPSEAEKTYYRSMRRDALDLANEIDGAALIAARKLDEERA